MVGTIQSDSANATLEDDGVWHSDDEEFAAMLNLEYNPSQAQGVAAVLPFGTGAVMQAAEDLGIEYSLVQEIPPLTSLDNLDEQAEAIAEVLVGLIETEDTED